MHKKRDKVLKNVLESVLRSTDNPWTQKVTELAENLGVSFFNRHRRKLKEQLIKVAVARVMLTKQIQVSMIHMPTPHVWFKLQPHVRDTKAGKILNMFRAGDAGLGNRRTNKHGKSCKYCPLCLDMQRVVFKRVSHGRCMPGSQL